jgi:hypothetical protein
MISLALSRFLVSSDCGIIHTALYGASRISLYTRTLPHCRSWLGVIPYSG